MLHLGNMNDINNKLSFSMMSDFVRIDKDVFTVKVLDG